MTNNFHQTHELQTLEGTYKAMKLAARTIDTSTMYLENMWAREQRDFGLEVPTISSLQYELIDRIFFNQYGDTTRKQFFLSLWGPRIELTDFLRKLLLDPWVRYGQPLPISGGTVRPVYRVTHPLGSSQASSSTLAKRISVIFSTLPVSHHWATQVGKGTLRNTEPNSNINHPEAPFTRADPAIFELTAKDGIIDQDRAVGQYTDYASCEKRFIGYTFLPDEEIETIGMRSLQSHR